MKHFSSPKTSKYYLMTSKQDSSGELKTHFYKTCRVPTAGNGAQIIPDGAASPKQQSPSAIPSRKRHLPTGELKHTEAACAISVEEIQVSLTLMPLNSCFI
jgi:hypothetical protein